MRHRTAETAAATRAAKRARRAIDDAAGLDAAFATLLPAAEQVAEQAAGVTENPAPKAGRRRRRRAPATGEPAPTEPGEPGEPTGAGDRTAFRDRTAFGDWTAFRDRSQPGDRTEPGRRSGPAGPAVPAEAANAAEASNTAEAANTADAANTAEAASRTGSAGSAARLASGPPPVFSYSTSSSNLSAPEGPSMTRIVILSASVGAGHDSAAAALADRMTARGFTVDRRDFLDLMPGGRAMCESYKRIITRAPGLYQRIYARTERHGHPGRMQRGLLRGAERAVLAAIPEDTAAVVATYPLAAQVLGRLRRTGRLAVPVATLFTDFAVHPLWIADGVDLHLAATAASADQALAHGAARVRVVGPLVGGRFAPAAPARKTAARERFGLPLADDGARLALLLGGSWGVGEIEETAVDLAASGVVTPVVVCGRNTALADRLRARGLAHVFGWVDDMPALMAAADVMVQNAGAASTLEAFATGLPVATYRELAGHGRGNAEVLDRTGLAAWIRTGAELPTVLAELTDGPRGRRQRTAALDLVARGRDGADQALLDLVHEHADGAVAVLSAANHVTLPAQRGTTADVVAA